MDAFYQHKKEGSVTNIYKTDPFPLNDFVSILKEKGELNFPFFQ